MKIEDTDKEKVTELLTKLLEIAEREDSAVRDDLVREAKRNDLFWHGFQHIFWDSIAMDWRIPTHDDLRNLSNVSEEADFLYDYVINIIKPHGESIIAALSSDIPSVRFKPFDPEESTDISSAKTANSISEKIAQDNNDKLLFMHSLFTLYTEHILGGYTYSDEDSDRPPVKVPVFGKSVKRHISSTCSKCPYTSEDIVNKDIEINEQSCPECGGELLNVPSDINVTEQIREEDHPRTRQVIETYGILNLKVPLYAKLQKGYGYIVNYIDSHYSEAREVYSEIADKILPGCDPNSDRYLRSPSHKTLSTTSEHSDLVTIKRCWFRPSYFNCLENEDAAFLKGLFPKGVRADFINELIGRIENESMDAHWRFTKPGLSRFSHSDPGCNSLIPLQELRNNSINYIVQSLEYSVPDSYADPRVIDFDAYRKSENSPGLLYPATTQALGDRPLSDFFHSSRTATMPREGVDFIGLIDSDSQNAVGDFPSVHGGPGKAGSKTLGEYVQSRAYALQRLSIPWVLLNVWWAELMHISVKDYMRNLLTDDFFTRESKSRFDKVWIRKAFTEGDFEVIYPESSDKFPVSAAQKIALVLDLVKLNSPEINSVLFSNLNAREVADIVGLTDIKFPNELQANKQYREIEMMLEAPAIDLGDGTFGSTVQIEPEIDIDEIHLDITGNFLCSDTGQDLKASNPDIYMNILAHHREHFLNIQMKLQSQVEEGEKDERETQPI